MPPDFSRGANPLGDGRTRFEVWAPRASRVIVEVISGNGADRHVLERSGGGVHSAVVAGVPCGSDYVYRLDGGPGRPDPVSRLLPAGVHGPTRIVDPASFAWTDQGWRGIAMADAIIYELHVGTFTSAGTFDAAAERLPYLRSLGVTAIEIMPVSQFPGTRNWGYDGASLYAVQESYGGPDGLRRFLDAAHAQRLAVLLDVVYNHVGPEGNYLSEFGPYFSNRSLSTWGEGFNLDGPDSDEVRRYLVQNASYWITEYHFDGLRLDAADRIVDLGALHLLEELTAAVHERGRELGRQTLVIAESDANDPRYLLPAGDGGLGLDAQWSDDFHHAVHAALTGERQGYYADFAEPASVGKALAERFVNDGRYSAYRRRRHGRLAAHIPGDRFVICVQNHDQVGNRARGERLSTLVCPDSLRLAAAILLLSPYVPLIFMGEEYGESAPFLYFVSHTDPALVEAVRQGRCREFAGFAWSGEVPDPADPSTFERSRLAWARSEQPGHAELLTLYRDLMTLRKSEPALWPGAAPVRLMGGLPDGIVAAELGAGSRRLAAFYNFSGMSADVPLPAGVWEIAMSTDSAAYGGGDRSTLDSPQARVAAHSALLLRTRTA